MRLIICLLLLGSGSFFTGCTAADQRQLSSDTIAQHWPTKPLLGPEYQLESASHDDTYVLCLMSQHLLIPEEEVLETVALKKKDLIGFEAGSEGFVIAVFGNQRRVLPYNAHYAWSRRLNAVDIAFDAAVTAAMLPLMVVGGGGGGSGLSIGK